MASSRGSNRPGNKKTAGSGRVTTPRRHEGSSTGRYLSAEERGRYTPPIPSTVHQSPEWYGPMVITLFVLGLLTIILNYLAVLPGSVSSWYLLGGILVIFIGLAAMLRYH